MVIAKRVIVELKQQIVFMIDMNCECASKEQSRLLAMRCYRNKLSKDVRKFTILLLIIPELDKQD